MGVNFLRLQKSIEWSVQQLSKQRKVRVDAIREYVGNHYGDGGSEWRVPTNFLEMASTIYSRQLAARAPRVVITARNPELRPYAKNMEIALNQLPEEVDLANTLHSAVMEALFSFAIVKVGIEGTGDEVLGHEYGRPFADMVSLDDYFCDMTAKRRDQMQYEGNDYWVSLGVARGMCEECSPDDLIPDEHSTIGDDGGERAETVSVSTGGDIYGDQVWLRDVWLPLERKLVTYGVKAKKLLRIVPWDGPDSGPYHMLGYSEVPGNLLPLPPVALWMDLHELANSLFRKMGRGADARKTVAGFKGGHDEDVAALKAARDGDAIRYDGQGPEAITTGGVDPATLALFIQIKDLFSYFAGNLDALGGLSPMTDTLGQDKMLAEAAGARMKHMTDKTITFAKSIFRSLAWYEWTDPVRKRDIIKPVKGTSIAIHREWSEATRKGRFLDYNLDIDVYSMQDDSPSTKIQKIGMIWDRYIVPVMPDLKGQGIQVDFQRLFEMLSRFANIPELNDIMIYSEPTSDEPVHGNPEPERSRKPAHTTRTYERVNRPGATRSGKDDVMTRGLMGIGAQPSEKAAIGRMVS